MPIRGPRGSNAARVEAPVWRGAEIRHFVTLATVSETGSFRAAARRRGYVPSAVSQQIAELERIVGVGLVVRSRGQQRIELTEAGSLLARHGRRLRAELDAARAELDALGRAAAPRSLAISTVLAGSMLPELEPLLAAADGAPPPSIVETADDDEPAALVESGAVDFGVGSFPAPSSDLDAAVLRVDPYVLLAPRSPGLTLAGDEITAAELAERRLILASGSRSAPSLQSRLAALGIDASGALRVPAWELGALVAAGAGVAVASASMRWPDERRIRRVDARSLLGAQAIALVWRRRGVPSLPRRAA